MLLRKAKALKSMIESVSDTCKQEALLKCQNQNITDIRNHASDIQAFLAVGKPLEHSSRHKSVHQATTDIIDDIFLAVKAEYVFQN